jgi:endoglucanase
MMKALFGFISICSFIFMLSCQSDSEQVDVYIQNQKIGEGVNILGYDPIWNSFDKARFKKKHFKIIRDAGFHTVRINLHPFRHMDSTTFELRSHWWKVLDWAVENALANDLNVILDMHEYDAMAHNPEGRKPMWLAFWKQLARHSQNYPENVLFELLNEPYGDFTDELWNQYLAEGLALVRETNPSRTVIIGPGDYNSIGHLDSLVLPEHDRNIIVAIHYYSPDGFTFQGAAWADRADSLGIKWLGTEEEKQVIIEDFRTAQTWSEKNKRPLFLDEFGVSDSAEIDSRTRYLSFIVGTAEDLGWSWAYWQYDDDFIIYDIENDCWIEPVLNAIIH